MKQKIKRGQMTNKTIENAIRKIISEGSKTKREMGKAAARAGVALEDPSLTKYGKNLYAKGNPRIVQRRNSLDVEDKTKKSIKKVVASGIEAVKAATQQKSSPAPSKGKLSDDVRDSLKDKIGDKLSLATKAVEKGKSSSEIKIGAMKKVFVPSAPTKEPEKNSGPTPNKHQANEDKIKALLGKKKPDVSKALNYVSHRRHLQIIQPYIKEKDRAAIKKYNEKSTDIAGEFPGEETNGKKLKDRGYFGKALAAVRKKVGWGPKRKPAFPYPMAI